MTFLAPLFLLAAISVAIPVVIHLLNLRKPEKVSFSTLAFFRELQKSTIRRLRIKRLLLLAVRILTVLFLVMALARPYSQVSVGNVSGPVVYGILIENGIGMNRVNADGPLLHQAVELGREIIQNARDTDRFIVMNTHGNLARSGILDARAALEVLETLEISTSGSLSSRRLVQLSQLLNEAQQGARVIYRITTIDGVQRHIDWFSAREEAMPDKHINFVLVGSEGSNNIGVTDVRTTGTITGPGRPLGLEVSVQNLGTDRLVNQYVSLEFDGRSVGQYQVDLEVGAGQTLLFEIVPARSGTITGRVILEGDPFIDDNIRHLSLNVPEVRRVLVLGDARSNAGRYLRAALMAAEQVQGIVRFEEHSDASSNITELISEFDAVILNGLNRIEPDLQDILARFVQSGNGLVFLPSERGDIQTYNQLLSRLNLGSFSGIRGAYGSFEPYTRIDRIRDDHPVIRDIFDKQEHDEVRVTLPSLFYSLIYRPNQASAMLTILQSELPEPVLVEHRFGNGRVILSTISPDPGWSTFPGNALFAPVFYRSVIHVLGGVQGQLLNHYLGAPFEAEFRTDGLPVEIHGEAISIVPDSEPMFSGHHRIRYIAEDWVPGIYRVTAGEREWQIAANLHISESDFRSLSIPDVGEKLTSIAGEFRIIGGENLPLAQLRQEVRSAGFGSELWYWFVLIAILFLILELAISRWYKAETIE